MMFVPLAAVALLWFLMSRSEVYKRLLRRVRPDMSAKLVSIVLVVAAILVLARGNVWAALCLFGGSLWLLGRTSRQASSPTGRATQSHVRSQTIEMDYDSATGRITGRVFAGPHAGTLLDTLDLAQCLSLFSACLQSDPDGARLLHAYLDGRFPGWRAAPDGDSDAGERRARFTSRMTEEEAYQVLGLRHGASRDDIVRSHRALMKKWHPDQGGTAILAARANEAKEVLLRRHA